jgi:predicted SAM-dependent methyltransferase
MRLRRFINAPTLPQNTDGSIKIHLGCGDVVAEGYINVDLKRAPHVHYIHDVTNLPFLEDNVADLVYACHVLEHFSFERLKYILWEWRRILNIGGVLRLSIPDFDKLLVLYKESNNDVESIRQPLMGFEDGYSSHLLLFNYNFIKKVLEDNGFRNVRIWDPSSVSDHDFDDWASRGLVRDGKTYLVSLNIEAEKIQN